MYTVLVVDDAMFMRMVIKKLLISLGITTIQEASNGLEAIQKYKQVMPDLVIMDITMPEMDGIEAVKQIISFDKNAKIIMVSAMGQQSMVIEALKAGAKSFIVKPFDNVRFEDEIRKILK